MTAQDDDKTRPLSAEEFEVAHTDMAARHMAEVGAIIKDCNDRIEQAGLLSTTEVGAQGPTGQALVQERQKCSAAIREACERHRLEASALSARLKGHLKPEPAAIGKDDKPRANPQHTTGPAGRA